MRRGWAIAVFGALWATAGGRATAAPPAEEERYQAAFTDGDHVLLVTDDDRVRTVVPKPYKEGDAVAISPDGRSIAYTSFDKASGYELLYLASAPEFVGREIGAKNSWHRDPTFSADGKKVLFALHPNAHWSERFQPGKSAQLFEVDLQTLDLHQLTSDGACHHHPSYSRTDGTTSQTDDGIYFIKTNCRTTWNIARFEPKTGKTELITKGMAQDHEPSVSPDGQSLAYVDVGNRGSEIAVRDLATGRTHPVASLGGPMFVQLTWEREGHRLLWWKNGAVWEQNVGGRRPVRLTEAP